MSPDLKSAQDDLAYMRALIAPRDQGQAPFGRSYVAGGLCYGAQLVGHWAQAIGWYPSEGLAALLLGGGPTVVFLAILSWIIWRDRKRPTGGVQGRAIGLMFGSVGLANIALLALFGTVAAREKSLTIWLIYPCTVFILQGLVWMTVGALRRRAWMGVVGVAWFANALVMGLLIGSPLYMLATAFGLFVLMAGMGFVLIELARRAQAA
jgi:hypothetical protein